MMRFLPLALLAFAIVPTRAVAAPEKHLDIRRLPQIGTEDAAAIPFERSIVNESRVYNYGVQSSASPPPEPSPGLSIATTSWDAQHDHSQGHQIGQMPGTSIVHFCWTAWDIIPQSADEASRYVAYSSSTKFGNGNGWNQTNQPFGGVYLTENTERGGSANLSCDETNRAQVFLHKSGNGTSPVRPWHYNFPTPGSGAFNPPMELGGTAQPCEDALWPHGDAAHDAGSAGSPIHVVAHSATNCQRDVIWYWRFDGVVWQGPAIIDSNFARSYVVCDDPNSNKVAIALHTDREPQFIGLNNVGYYESTTGGLGWLSGAETGDANKVLLTNFTNATGPQAWLHISAAYDNAGALHIVWDEQRVANVTEHVAIRHWNSDRNTIRPVVLGYWDSPMSSGAFNLNLSDVTMGIGDGTTMCQNGTQSNDNYVYITYTQYAGPTVVEQADTSNDGVYNGELYLVASNSQGDTWSPPVNLTRSRTPNCNPGPPCPACGGVPPRPDSVCRSEAWGTIAKYIRDIDILFISDLDAGAIAYGEGTWQQNPVHYLRFPGGPANPNALHVCPVIATNLEATLTKSVECEYHAPQAGSNVETLTIFNLGNATLNYSAIVTTDFPGAPTLVLQNPGSSSIIAGNPEHVQSVTMTSNDAPEGLHQGTISITHDDGSEPSPRTFPIDFFVYNDFTCNCSCPCANDPECDSVTTVIDVMRVIDVAFRAIPPVLDPDCPVERTDIDCSGYSDVLDVMRVVNVAFRNANPSTEYCAPCP